MANTNRPVSVWRGDNTPPTIYHVWIKSDDSLWLYNGGEWEERYNLLDENGRLPTNILPTGTITSLSNTPSGVALRLTYSYVDGNGDIQSGSVAFNEVTASYVGTVTPALFNTWNNAYDLATKHEQDIEDILEDLSNREHFRGSAPDVADLDNFLNPGVGDYVYVGETGTKWAYTGTTETGEGIYNGWENTGELNPTTIITKGTDIPLMDREEGDAGTSTDYASIDHIHPSDITKANLSGGKVVEAELPDRILVSNENFNVSYTATNAAINIGTLGPSGNPNVVSATANGATTTTAGVQSAANYTASQKLINGGVITPSDHLTINTADNSLHFISTDVIDFTTPNWYLYGNDAEMNLSGFLALNVADVNLQTTVGQILINDSYLSAFDFPEITFVSTGAVSIEGEGSMFFTGTRGALTIENSQGSIVLPAITSTATTPFAITSTHPITINATGTNTAGVVNILAQYNAFFTGANRTSVGSTESPTTIYGNDLQLYGRNGGNILLNTPNGGNITLETAENGIATYQGNELLTVAGGRLTGNLYLGNNVIYLGDESSYLRYSSNAVRLQSSRTNTTLELSSTSAVNINSSQGAINLNASLTGNINLITSTGRVLYNNNEVATTATLNSYLPLSGGTMAGDLVMNYNRIYFAVANTSTGIWYNTNNNTFILNCSDAGGINISGARGINLVSLSGTVKYNDAEIATVDNIENNYLKLSGGIMEGNINMNTNAILFGSDAYIDGNNSHITIHSGNNHEGDIIMRCTSGTFSVDSDFTQMGGDTISINYSSVGIKAAATTLNLSGTGINLNATASNGKVSYNGVEIATLDDVTPIRVLTATDNIDTLDVPGHYMFYSTLQTDWPQGNYPTGGIGVPQLFIYKESDSVATRYMQVLMYCNTIFTRSYNNFVGNSGGSWTQIGGGSSSGDYLPLTGGTLSGVLTSQTIRPNATNTYDIGSSTLRYENVYARTFNGSLTGSATLGALAVTNSATYEGYEIVSVAGANFLGAIGLNNNVLRFGSSSNATAQYITSTNTLNITNSAAGGILIAASSGDVNVTTGGQFLYNGVQVATLDDISSGGGSSDYTVDVEVLLDEGASSSDIETAIGGFANYSAAILARRTIKAIDGDGYVAVTNVAATSDFIDTEIHTQNFVRNIRIINTSGTLSKVITERQLLQRSETVDNLASNATTLPLSANQGRILNNSIANLESTKVSGTNVSTIYALTSAEYSAIGIKNPETLYIITDL